ncbi:MAG: HpcH/HpaI aldolase/citrate lyase family protein [Pseudomonadota bacterium]
MTEKSLPFWRSILFVPVLNEKFVRGAPGRGADCIQLDLEDAIPPDQKEEARQALPSVSDELAGRGCEVIVRINRPLRMAIPDLEAAVRETVCAVTLPKVPSPEHVHSLVEVIEEVEREQGLENGHTKLIAMVETAEGLLRINEIAAAHPRVIGIIVGPEDLAVSMGMKPTHNSLMTPNVQAVAAARAAGCMPLGFVGSIAGFTDLESYRSVIREARELGFMGAFAIHPNQVGVLNEEFAPSPSEVEQARALVETFEKAMAEGRGTAQFEGKMIDLPVVGQARAILEADRKVREKASA